MLNQRLFEAVEALEGDRDRLGGRKPSNDQSDGRRNFGTGLATDFLKCLHRLMRELNPWEAVLMAPLSILESVLLARVGTIAGSFYHLVVDKMQNELMVAMLYACALYAACIVIEAMSVWLSGYLAVTWRKTLITRLQNRYCTNNAFNNIDSSIDNADQRLTAELAKLCDLLGTVARLLSSAPIKIVYFSWLTHKYVGWKGVAAALAFFLISAAIQQLTAIPLARSVAIQERQEGNFRFLHMRLRSRAEDISLSGSRLGIQAELAALNATLAPVLNNQKRVVYRRALVTATSRTADYAGALLNYGLVAMVVFSGATEASSAGKMAEFVSNASYFTLSLIYSFTQILDLAETLGNVAALTVRTARLLEAVSKSDGLHEINHEKRIEGGSEMVLNPKLATLLLSPVEMWFFENTMMLEVSAHSFSAALGRELVPVFPDLAKEKSCNPIICCLTFQFAGDQVSLLDSAANASSPSRTADTVTNLEMDRLLESFLRWEACMQQEIAKAGPYWSDAVDPRTGMALHGHAGARWSEVAAAHLLLGYDRRDDGICPLILHPSQGSSAYPASMFTNAPWHIVLKVLRSLSMYKGGQNCIPLPHLSPRAMPFILMHSVTVCAPYIRAQKRVLIKDLSLSIYSGQHLLVTGPNGRGKTSLFKCMYGHDRPLEGVIEWPCDQIPPAHSNASSMPAMFLPQQPLTAPGNLLWQQIAYPGVDRPNDATMHSLLLSVGLGDLLIRVEGNFNISEPDWSAVLSAGELQRLVFARLLLRRPKFAFLDEPTSAMGDDDASNLIQLLQASGTTCLTISQDTSTMRSLHLLHLKLNREGGHELCTKDNDSV